jgi:pimeloyl-ACP methyl ester carboxylesterase
MNEQSTAIVLIHGFLDSGDIWKPVIKSLGDAASKYETPDLPGMGALFKDTGPFELERFAEIATTVIDRCAIPVVLVGHSMGAQVAELAAVRRSRVIRGLVLLSPVPLGGVHTPPEILQRLGATGGDIDAQRNVRRGFMAQPPDPIVLETLTQLGRRVRRDVTEAFVRTWDEGTPDGLVPSRFEGTVLVARGDSDPFVTAEMMSDVAARFRSSSRATLPKCGHWPQAERPESVATLIAKFVQSLSQKSGAETGSEGWRQAFNDRTEHSFGEKFAPDVVFDASVLARRVEGRERVTTILGTASRLYEALEFTHQAKDGNHTYLEWEARIVGGEAVSGVTALTMDASGAIKAIAIHHRPLPGVLHFSEKLKEKLAGKVEADLFFSP